MKEILTLSIESPDLTGSIQVKTPQNVPPNANILGNLPQFIITFLILIVIVASVSMIIFSGIQWIMSGGDTKKVEGARHRFTYAIIGLIVAILSVFIVSSVIRITGGDPSLFNIGNTNPTAPRQNNPIFNGMPIN